MHWRRKWQPTPVFLPGESQGWGRTESDTTEVTAAGRVPKTSHDSIAASTDMK